MELLRERTGRTALIVSVLGAASLLGLPLADQLPSHSRASVWAAAPQKGSGNDDSFRMPPTGNASITVDYPEDGSIFPPEITPPTFIWRDADISAKTWRVDIAFADGAPPVHANSHGEPMRIGEIDRRCISDTNQLPALTPQQSAAHTWTPDADTWALIKHHSQEQPATVSIIGHSASESLVSQGRVTLSTSKDPVGAPIFYRDVPLMPSAGEKDVVQPLSPSLLYLINWRVRDISQPESKVVMHDMHTCANCHSFSADGKTMGIDWTGLRTTKGLYAVVPVRQQMSIRNEDMVSWNSDFRVGQTRVGFMSQVSPDGRYVLYHDLRDRNRASPALTTSPISRTTVFSRSSIPRAEFWPGTAAPPAAATLPGADDPRYVQTDGVWSPDGKYIVFARAEAKDPYPSRAEAGRPRQRSERNADPVRPLSSSVQ